MTKLGEDCDYGGPIFRILIKLWTLPFNKFGDYHPKNMIGFRFVLVLSALGFPLPVGLNLYFAESAESLYGYFVDVFRVSVMVLALFSHLHAVTIHNKQFEIIWTSHRTWISSNSERFPLLFSLLCAIHIINYIYFVFINAENWVDAANILMEIGLSCTFWLLGLVTMFYCSTLNYSHQTYQNPSTTDTPKTEDFIALKRHSMAVKAYNAVNKLCGYHTLFLILFSSFDILQISYIFVMNYITLTPIPYFICFSRIMSVSRTLYIIVIQLSTCHSASLQVSKYYVFSCQWLNLSFPNFS